jgi:hypothetical protein
MSKGLASFCGAGLRAMGLGCCMLLAFGPGCERETFDLLAPNALGAAGLGSGSVENAGAASSTAGAAGSAASNGKGGSPSMVSAGSAGVSIDDPCLPGEQCTDGGLNCPATVAFCNRCTTSKDCDINAPFCDPEAGRCAECRVHGNDCAPGEICHPLTLRCVRGCTTASDCSVDHSHPLCDPFGACVSCATTTDCQTLYGHSVDVCFYGSCVECYADQQCAPDKPYCVGLRCQTKH